MNNTNSCIVFHVGNLIKIKCDIAIIGAGIAGSALACALRDSGLNVVIIEKSSEPLDTARGDHLKPSTCELLDRWGILPDFFKRGGQKRYVSKWRLPAEEPFYIADYSLSNATTDNNITLIKPCQSWRLDDDCSVTPRLTVETTNQSFSIKPKVLVGADGRASKVRQLFDFKPEIKRYQKPLVVLVGRPKDPELSSELQINVCKDRLITLIPRGEHNCKVAIPEARGQTKCWSEASEDELKQRLSKYLPDISFESLRFIDIYSPIDLQTEKWVLDNIILMGDSCHALHPARSEGMNLCITNADQLATELKQDPDNLTAALVSYERKNLEKTKTLLKENQRYAEMMDSDDEHTYIKLVEHLSSLADNSDAARARLVSTAGY